MSFLDDVLNFFTGTKTNDTQANTSQNVTSQQQTAQDKTSNSTQNTNATQQQATKNASATQQDTTTAQQQQTSQQQAQTSTGTTQQTATGNTSSLDAGTQQILQSLIAGMAPGAASVSGTQQNNVAAGSSALDALTNRATNPMAGQDIINALVGQAKQSYNEGEGRNIEQVANYTGSAQNSFVQQLRDEGQRKLATSIAGITAQTGLQLDQQNTAALQAAISGAGTNANTANSLLSGITALTNELKGANVSSSQSSNTDTAQNILSSLTGSTNTTGTSSTTSNTQAEQSSVTNSLQQLISALTEDTTGIQNNSAQQTGASTGSGDTSGSLLDFINAFTKSGSRAV